MPPALRSRRALSRQRAPLFWLALPYLVFVIYGSLVPLDFHALPWDEAVAKFREIPFLDLGIGSRADWVANLLLFIPLAFLWTGLLAHGRHPVVAALLTLLVWLAAAALSLGIEFTQLFFPQRTVSQNDILAEALGALLGIGAWWLLGDRALNWLEGWQKAHGRMETAHNLFWGYLLLLFGYNLLPLDLTISPVEIFHKFREGKVHLLPFAALAHEPAQIAYDLAVDTVIWAPVALFWVLRGGKPAPLAWRDTVLLAALLEGLQLFVYSRVSDVTDVFTAALGAAFGLILARPLLRHRGASSPAARPWPWIMAALAWLAVLPLVFWYPYDFLLERAKHVDIAALLAQAPLATFYFGTEFRAITEVVHKVGFFAPLGMLLALAATRAPYLHRVWYGGANFLLALAMALTIELGKTLLPDKFPSLTNVVLECAGAVIGYTLARYAARRFRMPAPRRARADRVPD